MNTPSTLIPTRVFIVDDHAVVLRGIEMLLATDPSIEIVGEASSGEEAIEKVPQLQPDIVLMDLVMPGMGGVPAIAAIKKQIPRTRVLVLTTYGDERHVHEALEAGADGYLLKDAGGDRLLFAIHSTHRGDMLLDPHVTRHAIRTAETIKPNPVILSQRELQVLQLVAQGCTNQQIGRWLHISSGTVKVHISSILAKLSVASRTEAAVRAVQLGLLSGQKER